MSEETELSREEQNQQVFQQAPPPMPPSPTQQIPVEVVTLPSRGALYSLENVLANEQQVEIKCMTAQEEDLLTSPALLKNGTVLSKLLEACIINRTIDASSMLTGDRNAVLIALRITGYGAGYEVEIECPECHESFDHEFNLSELVLKPLGTAPLQSNINRFEFKLPKSGATVHFRLLTGRDEKELSQAISMKKKVTRSQVQNTVTSRLMQSVVSIGGETDLTKIANAIRSMPAADSRALRKYIDDIEPGVVMEQIAECEHCTELSEVQVPMGLTFFWPDAG